MASFFILMFTLFLFLFVLESFFGFQKVFCL